MPVRGDAPGVDGVLLVTSSVTVAAIRPAAAAAASQRPEGKRESLFGPWLISSNRHTWPGVHATATGQIAAGYGRPSPGQPAGINDRAQPGRQAHGEAYPGLLKRGYARSR